MSASAEIPSNYRYNAKWIPNFINKISFSSYIWCVCGVALFHFVLSYLPLVNPSQRERTTLDSWLRLVARGFIRWSTFQKLKTKNFFEKKPLYWRAANKRDTFRENKKLQKPEDFEEVIEDRRSVPKKGILNEKMDLNILISQLNHDVQNEMKVSL